MYTLLGIGLQVSATNAVSYLRLLNYVPHYSIQLVVIFLLCKHYVALVEYA